MHDACLFYERVMSRVWDAIWGRPATWRSCAIWVSHVHMRVGYVTHVKEVCRTCAEGMSLFWMHACMKEACRTCECRLGETCYVALEGLKRQRARVCACQYRSFDPAIGVPNAGVFVCMFACMIDACVYMCMCYMCMCTRVVCMSLPLFWILTSVFGTHLFMYASMYASKYAAGMYAARAHKFMQHACMHACMYICIYVCEHACILCVSVPHLINLCLPNAGLCVHVHMCMCTCAHVYVNICREWKQDAP